MLIGFDGNEANIENRVGVNYFAYKLLHQIVSDQKKWPEKTQLIVFLKNKPLSDLPAESNFIKYEILPTGKFWQITRMMPRLLFGSPKPSVFFSPGHYLPPISTVPMVVSIMDLGYLENSDHFRFSDFWQLKLWSAWSMFVASKVVAISQSAMSDIVRHYEFAKNKVSFTYLGVDPITVTNRKSVNDVRRIEKKYSIVRGKYFLYLGTLKPSKNIDGVVRAFELFKKSSKTDGITLVIAGKKGWLYDEIFDYVKRANLEDCVIFTGYVDETEKKALYKGALALVSPSYWEGFGLHVVEAMQYGTPVIISKRGSLPEVGGKRAEYIDPQNVGSIQKAMQKIALMSPLQRAKIAKELETYSARFVWGKTAEDIMAILLAQGERYAKR